tara:strand:+ start:7431 stop:8081 length:651 start_codon:yes stop_codon:yes gene_type:complete
MSNENTDHSITSDSDETIAPPESPTVSSAPPSPAKKNRKPRKSKARSKSEDDVKDDVQDDVVIEHVNPVCNKKPRGRPKKPLEEKLAKKVVVKEKVIYMVPDKDGNYKKVKNPALTQRDIKKIELEKEKEQKEIELGKVLVTKKNGKIDKRSSKPRTPAQIEATKKLLAANEKRRQMQKQIKDTETKQMIKDSVKEVVNEPFYEPKKHDPYENIRF